MEGVGGMLNTQASHGIKINVSSTFPNTAICHDIFKIQGLFARKASAEPQYAIPLISFGVIEHHRRHFCCKCYDILRVVDSVS